MWPSLGPEPRAVSRQPGRQPMSGVIVVPSPPNEVRLGELKTLDSLDMEKNIKTQLHQKLKLRWDFNEEQSGAAVIGFACAPWIDLDGEYFIDGWIGETSWKHKLIRLKYPLLIEPGDSISLFVKMDFTKVPGNYQAVAYFHPHNIPSR